LEVIRPVCQVAATSCGVIVNDSLTAGIDRTAEATIPLPFLVQLLRE